MSVNVVLFGLKFIFIALLYVLILLLIRAVFKDTKLATSQTIDEPAPARLVLNFGSADSKSFALADKLVIGRSEAADITLEDDFASANHARINRQGNTYVIQDLKSTNKTRVNGAEIGKAALSDGDEISIGKTKLKFIQ